LENIGDNVFLLDLPTYMQMYSVVNVENLKLYEPPLVMDTKEVAWIHAMENFALEYLAKFPEDIILNRKTITSQ